MKTVFSLFLIFLALNSHAQHQHNMPGMSDSSMKNMTMKKTTEKKTTTIKKSAARENIGSKKKPGPTDTTMMKMNMEATKTDDTSRPMNMNKTMPMNQMNDTMKQDMKMNMDHMNMNMFHSFSRNLPMSRNGSGTSWMPDAGPMYMYMKMGNKSMFMLHGNIFLRYEKQDLFNKGSRGGHHFDAPNWFMAMYDYNVGAKGLFSTTTMISLDPLLVTRAGYPLLFQSGESYKGKKLVDRQHPHDLFSGLSIGYTQMLSKDADVFAYFGYPGEPALGPIAFMHRISTMNNPDAPLGHHWQDATHITFGVGTLGFRYKNFKLEGSIFTGREPDEHRYDFDEMRFDSYSYRLSANPSENWALQFSQGFIHSPELLEPGIDITRTTASAIFSKWLKTKHDYFTQSLVWGLNHSNEGQNAHSVLYEANLQLDRQAIYARYEFVQKSGEELDIPFADVDQKFNINAFTLGYNRAIWNFSFVQLAAGAQGTINFSPKELQFLYGKTPIAGEIYLQLKPTIHRHK
jgi:hypothetical protein